MGQREASPGWSGEHKRSAIDRNIEKIRNDVYIKKRPDGPERFVARVESMKGMDIGIIFSP